MLPFIPLTAKEPTNVYLNILIPVGLLHVSSIHF